MPLTPKQKNMLDFISSYTSKHSYAPTQHEIARHFGFTSLGTVQNYLVRLEKEGHLTKEWNQRRSLSVAATTTHTADSIVLPLMGRVAAGQPIEAIESQKEVSVPASMVKRGEHFVLHVAGDSMIDDGIWDGDLIVIKKQKVAENGQTVVALVDGSATVKRFYRKADRVELHPANSSYKPIIVSSDQEFQIEGILSGLIRKYG